MRVCIVGAAGRMGQEVCRAILAECDIDLVGAVDPVLAGKDIGEVIGSEPLEVIIDEDIDTCIKRTKPDIAVDFTHPDVVYKNIIKYMEEGVAAVVGTTGLTNEQLEQLKQESSYYEAHVLIAPNFAIGAILMMHFAEVASKYMPHAEIIELHHDKKADAPSGTSIKTAEKMQGELLKIDEKETYLGVRGAVVNNTRIHSVRLPGLVAHQEVIFGGQGQTLTVRHDSIDRTSFMPGVILAINRIKDYPGLTYGLENYMEI